MEILSTAAGGGALTISWDFVNRKVQTFRSVCISGQCLYSAIDPGFMTPSGTPPDGFYQLAAGTDVAVEIVDIDPAETNQGRRRAADRNGPSGAARQRADAAHTSVVADPRPPGVFKNYGLSFKLTTTSSAYAESEVFSVVVTNRPTPTPNAPSPRHSAAPPAARMRAT